MKATALAVALLLAVPAANAQTVCAQPPVPTWTVQFFDTWQGAVAKMVANSAYNDTMSLIPVRSATKNGYLVAFEKMVHYDNQCPPQPLDAAEENTAGWHREMFDSPALAQAFVASLSSGTPVAMTSLYAGYTAGIDAGGGRRRGATHSSLGLPPRGIVVMWFGTR
ncbi:MAG TPA: hypothetical protein VFT12_15020 [Thermoanaerobaculia bacterium]|nr:hypothetical protein [Thermoanaerobaculia bacterium]